MLSLKFNMYLVYALTVIDLELELLQQYACRRKQFDIKHVAFAPFQSGCIDNESLEPDSLSLVVTCVVKLKEYFH